MADRINLVKLCVGAESVQDLLDWHAANRHRYPEGRTFHVTRMWPRREAEVLRGSLYWVFKGMILARQKILGLDEVSGADGVRRCAILLDAEVIRTEPVPRRPFQGWRYLPESDSPRDLAAARRGDDALPEALAAALAEIGLR